MTGATVAAAPGSGGRGNRIPFAYMATWAFLLYGLGYATPYLRVDLHLTEFETGLHGSALAIGTFGAGVGVDLLSRRLGSGWLLDLGIALLATGTGLIVLAPALPVSLAGALVMGLGGATIGTSVNALLSRSEEAQTRRLMGQANALAMIAAAAAPLAMGLAASGLHAWRVALLLPVAAFPVLTAIRPRKPETRIPIRTPGTSVPRAYWFTWLLLVLGVAIEFSFVFWGSTIVGRRTGISSADATLLATLFVLGMFLGRLAIGRGLGGGRAPLRVVAAGLVVALAGSSLVWVSTTPVLSAVGLFLGGLGTAGVWPIGLTVAMQGAPGAQIQASARATLGSSIAVLLAPSALGLTADAVGVTGAWSITLGLAVAALIVVAVTPRSARAEARTPGT